MGTDMNEQNQLGLYLRDRRTKLDPAALGFTATRRRTAGLRREEVAQRANISTTWYTWLEQGRGGAASADVLDRIARALMLTDVEREHLFLLGLGRPPEVRYSPPESVSPRLKRILDALDPCPALVRTVTWDVVAWNTAARVMLTDYSQLEPRQRNVLRLMFGNSRVRTAQPDWESVARFVVGVFRADVARAGAMAEVAPLVEELSLLNPAFAAMWNDNEVRSFGEGIKRIHHPELGPVSLEYSAFTVDGRPDLNLSVYNPADPADAARIQALIDAKRAATT
ncbi:helix-turn-helix transcriptional regulator [Azorhizobium oxalatiphilum]